MRAVIAALLLAGVAVPAVASAWQVNPAASRLTFGTVWNGRAIEGRFNAWNAAIRFDPRALDRSSVQVVVDLGSAATGERDVDGSLPNADWFALSQGRQARWTANRITQTAPNRFLARGTLTLRGVSVPVDLPFTLSINGNVATMTGETRVDRRTFRIGMDSDATGDWVAFAVPIRVQLSARRAG